MEEQRSSGEGPGRRQRAGGGTTGEEESWARGDHAQVNGRSTPSTVETCRTSQLSTPSTHSTAPEK